MIHVAVPSLIGEGGPERKVIADRHIDHTVRQISVVISNCGIERGFKHAGRGIPPVKCPLGAPQDLHPGNVVKTYLLIVRPGDIDVVDNESHRRIPFFSIVIAGNAADCKLKA